MFLIDSLRDATSTAIDHTLPAPGNPLMTRRLDDGREFRIYKVFYTPRELEARLIALGWQPSLVATEQYFLYGSACLASDTSKIAG